MGLNLCEVTKVTKAVSCSQRCNQLSKRGPNTPVSPRDNCMFCTWSKKEINKCNPSWCCTPILRSKIESMNMWVARYISFKAFEIEVKDLAKPNKHVNNPAPSDCEVGVLQVGSLISSASCYFKRLSSNKGTGKTSLLLQTDSSLEQYLWPEKDYLKLKLLWAWTSILDFPQIFWCKRKLLELL